VITTTTEKEEYAEGKDPPPPMLKEFSFCFPKLCYNGMYDGFASIYSDSAAACCK
jgi:hypothetical protein